MRAGFSIALLLFAVFVVGCETVVTTVVDSYISQPRDIFTVFNGSNVTVSWQHSELGTENGYEIWRQTEYVEDDPVMVGEVGIDDKSFTDTDIEIDVVYDYRVRGIFDEFEGEFSYESGVGTILDPPRNLNGYAYNDYIKLDWELRDEMNPLLFEIYRSENSYENFELVKTVAGDLFRYKDYDVTSGHRFYYAVKAIYELGTSEMSPYVYVYFSK